MAPLENASACQRPPGGDHVVVHAVALQLVGDPGQLGDQRVHRTGASGAALPVGPLSAGGAAVGRIAAGVANGSPQAPQRLSVMEISVTRSVTGHSWSCHTRESRWPAISRFYEEENEDAQ